MIKNQFTVDFLSRDFKSIYEPVVTYSPQNPIYFLPAHMSWSCFGGPESAVLTTSSHLEKIFDIPTLIRCPVFIRDQFGNNTWWGYVHEIKIQFENCQISLSIDQLFNHVKVNYSFISPDNKLGEQLQTPPAQNLDSQDAYGVREFSVKRFGIDDDFALALRDTLLEQLEWPSTVISQREGESLVTTELHCKGWFSTLGWRTYQNLEGFWGNYAPGPGMFEFENSSSRRRPSQTFTPGAAATLKYSYFMLRKTGSPTSNLTSELRSSAGALIATSGAYSGALLSDRVYNWIRFYFPTLPTLAGGTTYMIGVASPGTSSSNFYSIRIDEDQKFSGGDGLYYNGSAYVSIPSVTQPGGRPDLYFRVITVTDTGTQIQAIAAHGNQFFTRIESLQTGVFTSPYKDNDYDHLRELEILMQLGTANQRLILAAVDPERRLRFFEQPSQEAEPVFINRDGSIFTSEGARIYPWLPPVGSWSRFAGSSRIHHPWDRHRIPPSFISRAAYTPGDQVLRLLPLSAASTGR